LGIKAAGA